MIVRSTVALALASIAAPLAAQPVCELPITAYLSDADGSPLSGETDVELRFYIDDAPAALPVECRRAESAAIEDGWLRVMIDTCADPAPSECGTSPLTEVIAAAASGDGLWVGVVVGEAAELTPRFAVGAVPFAVRSADSARLGGDGPEAFERAGTAEGLLADHAADADAHHPADSSGIHIHPDAVTVGETVVTDGTVDLGPDADDEITAEIARTLTGGGNADTLHGHAGDSHAGGVCYTAFGQATCGEGFTAQYTGIAVYSALISPSYNTGGPSSTICLSDAGVGTTGGGLPWWTSVSLVAVQNDDTFVNTSDDGPVTCAVCCR